MRFDDRVVVVTGGGQGIGKAYADRFLMEGAKVAIAEVNPERAEAAYNELAAKGDVLVVETDVSDEGSAKRCADQVQEQLGSIDVLVNNAGVYYDLDRSDHSFEYLKKVFDVNLHGCWLMTRAVAPYMAGQGRGRIINQSSDSAYLYVTDDGQGDEFERVNNFAYAQSKWGVIGLTKFTAGQLGKFGITVNCIAPGVTMTEATKKVVPPGRAELLTKQTALRRTLEPEDVAGVAAFFASDDAALVTGQVLCVDAGLCMPA